MAGPPNDDPLELLAVTLVDIRATIDAQKRAVVHAQSSVEQFRHTKGKELLDDIVDCLQTIATDNRDLVDAVSVADAAVEALIASTTSS
jgi:CHASE3 domain sensor protein